MNTLIRITTIPLSLEKLLEGQLNFMQDHYRVLAVASEEKKLKKLGESLGVETFSVEMTRKITPFKDLSSVIKLFKLFKKEKPLIVHTHTPKAGIAGMLAAKMAGVPIRLHTVAGLPLLEAKGTTRKMLEAVEKITFASATKVYPNSHKIKEFLIENNFGPSKKFKVIGKGSSNGIDTLYFDPELYTEEDRLRLRKELNIPEEHLVYIFVGRLVRDKGINELVEAFQELNKEFSNSSLILVGPYEAGLDPLKDSTLEKIKINPHIHEVGYQNDVRPFLACSDVLAFPSYREGFPNVVLQAGAMGLPSIVTDINGCNEIIKEGENGTIIPIRDEAALYDAMKMMILKEEKREYMKSKSRKMIKEDYERDVIWKAILEEYQVLEKELKST
ncbi:glycosyltransferase family 4 protein [Salinimicrobium gaetbulicola]|uniref:Glycosyltransferase family 4 protein n=1 Tax=Salinimicrobium gaetbulicola TaxID=999702 RepID=A0ABW3IDY0_9FLAO